MLKDKTMKFYDLIVSFENLKNTYLIHLNNSTVYYKKETSRFFTDPRFPDFMEIAISVTVL